MPAPVVTFLGSANNDGTNHGTVVFGSIVPRGSILIAMVCSNAAGLTGVITQLLNGSGAVIANFGVLDSGAVSSGSTMGVMLHSYAVGADLPAGYGAKFNFYSSVGIFQVQNCTSDFLSGGWLSGSADWTWTPDPGTPTITDSFAQSQQGVIFAALAALNYQPSPTVPADPVVTASATGGWTLAYHQSSEEPVAFGFVKSPFAIDGAYQVVSPASAGSFTFGGTITNANRYIAGMRGLSAPPTGGLANLHLRMTGQYCIAYPDDPDLKFQRATSSLPPMDDLTSTVTSGSGDFNPMMVEDNQGFIRLIFSRPLAWISTGVPHWECDIYETVSYDDGGTWTTPEKLFSTATMHALACDPMEDILYYSAATYNSDGSGSPATTVIAKTRQPSNGDLSSQFNPTGYGAANPSQAVSKVLVGRDHSVRWHQIHQKPTSGGCFVSESYDCGTTWVTPSTSLLAGTARPTMVYDRRTDSILYAALDGSNITGQRCTPSIGLSGLGSSFTMSGLPTLDNAYFSMSVAEDNPGRLLMLLVSGGVRRHFQSWDIGTTWVEVT